MDIYKQKFTQLQQEILRLLFANLGETFNQREIAKKLKKSPTAVGKSLKFLQKENLLTISKNKSSNFSIIELNLENKKIFEMKRIENLRLIYESGLSGFLEEKFTGKTIVLFGSYSKGEDTKDSDIDIAIIGSKEENLNLGKFENLLKKEIRVQFYKELTKIHKNLKENIFNGIILSGGFSL